MKRQMDGQVEPASCVLRKAALLAIPAGNGKCILTVVPLPVIDSTRQDPPSFVSRSRRFFNPFPSIRV